MGGASPNKFSASLLQAVCERARWEGVPRVGNSEDLHNPQPKSREERESQDVVDAAFIVEVDEKLGPEEDPEEDPEDRPTEPTPPRPDNPIIPPEPDNNPAPNNTNKSQSLSDSAMSTGKNKEKTQEEKESDGCKIDVGIVILIVVLVGALTGLILLYFRYKSNKLGSGNNTAGVSHEQESLPYYSPSDGNAAYDNHYNAGSNDDFAGQDNMGYLNPSVTSDSDQNYGTMPVQQNGVAADAPPISEDAQPGATGPVNDFGISGSEGNNYANEYP